MERTEEIIRIEKGIRKIGEKAKDYLKKELVTGKNKLSGKITEIDALLEEEIKNLIQENYPGMSIFGAETGGEINEEDCWIIDPIDGTNAYTRGLPSWCMAMGRMKRGEFVYSLIYVPYGVFGDEVYTAFAGRGAFLNGEKMQVSRVSLLDEATVYIRSSDIRKNEKIREFAGNARWLYVTGSTALALTQLASGKLDMVLAKNQPLWDRIATLLVTEAGGKVVLTEEGNGKKTVFGSNGVLKVKRS